MLKLSTYRSKAKGLPDLLPYGALIEPDIILCKDGSFMASWEIRGKDTESSTDGELAVISMRMNDALRKQLGSGWMMHVDSIRTPTSQYLDRSNARFPDAVSRMLDDARRKTFMSGRFYTTTNVLTLCWKPSQTEDRLRKIAAESRNREETFLESSLKAFKKRLEDFQNTVCTVLSLDRLKSFSGNDEEGFPCVFSPFLSFVQLCLLGEEYLPRLPHTPMYLDAVVGGRDLTGGLAPRLGKKHIAVIALDALPSESWPSMLSALSSMPFESRFSTRFIFMDKFEALKEIDKYRKTWAQSIYKFFDKIFNKINPRTNRDALSMTQDAENAYAALQGDEYGFGFYTANVVLLDENRAGLEENARFVQRLLMDRGFGCRREEINCLEAWLSTHPGNSWANVRRPLVSTLNLADFLPLASVWTGSQTCPCPYYPSRSAALLQCATNSSTPFWLNLYSGDVGHTMITGPTGSGKSTLLATMAWSFLAYPGATVFVFDKGMSMYPICKGVKGRHYNVGDDDSPSFSPLRDIVSSADIAWAEDFIATLCGLQGLAVQPVHRDAIHDAMLQLSAGPREMRTLTSFSQRCQNIQVKQALQYYTVSGPMGHLLDAEEDGLSASYFTVFEIEKLMEMGEENCLPVLLYLFRNIEKSLHGQPAVLILDEVWLMLASPFFKGKIREWLKVMRKAVCAVVMATQSLADYANSGITDTLTESCPTKIYLPNGEAENSVFAPLYAASGLNEREIRLLAEATPKAEYFVVSPSGRRLMNLALSPLELAFVGSSSRDNIKRINELEKEYADEWFFAWIKERGLESHAAGSTI